MKLHDDTVHLRVAAVPEVAKLLDEDRPGWEKVLVSAYGQNLRDLAIHDAFNCVTAAVYGDYGSGVATLEEIVATQGMDPNLVNFATSCYHEDDATLRAAWLVEVRARQN